MGEQHFLTLCIGFQRTIRTYNQLSLNTAIKAYQNNHDKFVIMLEVRKTFQNLIWIWEFMQPWWCIKSNAKIKHHFTPWNLSFILNLNTLAIKYKKCLQNYYMQKYPLSDIPALAVNTLHILEINKKHEWKDTTSDPMCPYASFLLNHRKPEKLSRSLPRHKRAVFSLILLPHHHLFLRKTTKNLSISKRCSVSVYWICVVRFWQQGATGEAFLRSCCRLPSFQ